MLVGRLKQPTFSIVTNDDSMEPQSPEQSSMMRIIKVTKELKLIVPCDNVVDKAAGCKQRFPGSIPCVARMINYVGT